ncbi:hypothetical protein L3V83_15100 [Thiotrichales bacterium 19X7-9]|nr:hypothetical protein [Thiotrichales bacterium 19X7-9]
MAIINKPEPTAFTTLPKKIKITEDTYIRMLEYIEWHQSLDESDIDFMIEESLKHVFENDKEFKKYLKTKAKNNTQKTENKSLEIA